VRFKATICKDGRVVTEVIAPGGQTLCSEVYKATPPASERVTPQSAQGPRTTKPNDLRSDLSALAHNFVEQVLTAVHAASAREAGDGTGTGKPPLDPAGA